MARKKTPCTIDKGDKVLALGRAKDYWAEYHFHMNTCGQHMAGWECYAAFALECVTAPWLCTIVTNEGCNLGCFWCLKKTILGFLLMVSTSCVKEQWLKKLLFQKFWFNVMICDLRPNKFWIYLSLWHPEIWLSPQRTHKVEYDSSLWWPRQEVLQ